MSTESACPHLAHQPALETDFVIDQHLNMTDGFVHCAECGAAFLLELADMLNTTGVYRISSLSPGAVQKTVRSIGKGSCDISRARNEVFSLSTASTELDELLVMVAGQFIGTVPRPAGVQLPKRSWRELPCDGSVVRAAGLPRRL